MATTGIIQRRGIKADLISGIDPLGNWDGPVQTGEFVYATDNKEIGFLDSAGTLVWRYIDNFGGTAGIVHKGSDNPNDLPAFGEIGDNYMRQYEKVVTNEYSLTLINDSFGGFE